MKPLSHRVTALFLIVAVGLVLAALRSGGGGGPRVDGAAKPFLPAASLDLEAVRTLRIERSGRPPLVFERRDDGWVELLPSGLPVDPFLVREAIEAATLLTSSRVLPIATLSGSAGADLFQLGLDPPEAVVTISTPERDLVLRLGRVGVAGRAFVQPDGPEEDVFVVGQGLHGLVLGRDPRQWRLRLLMPEAGAETIRAGFEAGPTRVEIVRESGRWRLEQPVRTRADRAAIESWLQSVARAECDAFLEDIPNLDDAALGRFGLEPAVARLWVHNRAAPPAGSDRTLRIGAPVAVGGPDRFGWLEGHPSIMRLGAASLQSLFINPAALIEPTAVGAAAADVRSISFRTADCEFTIERSLDSWRCPQAGDAIADTARVEELLARLTTTRATAVLLQPPAPPTNAPTIVLRDFAGDVIATIAVGADRSRTQITLDAGDGVARVFPAALEPATDPAAYGLSLTPRSEERNSAAPDRTQPQSPHAPP